MTAKARQHFDFDEIEEYLRNKANLSTILHEIMNLTKIFEEQQNAAKWKVTIHFLRKDWLSKTKNAK